MVFLVEQAFVGRDEKQAPLKTPVWETIENLESHGIEAFHFPGLESHGI